MTPTTYMCSFCGEWGKGFSVLLCTLEQYLGDWKARKYHPIQTCFLLVKEHLNKSLSWSPLTCGIQTCNVAHTEKCRVEIPITIDKHISEDVGMKGGNAWHNLCMDAFWKWQNLSFVEETVQKVASEAISFPSPFFDVMCNFATLSCRVLWRQSTRQNQV
jgi:hypothetical protein